MALWMRMRRVRSTCLVDDVVFLSILTLTFRSLFHSRRSRRTATVHNSWHRLQQPHRRVLEQLLSTDPSSGLRASGHDLDFELWKSSPLTWATRLSWKKLISPPVCDRRVSNLKLHSLCAGCHSSQRDHHHPFMWSYEDKCTAVCDPYFWQVQFCAEHLHSQP